MPPTFQAPSWSEPVDLEALLRVAPRAPTVKGMMFQHVVDEARLVSDTPLGRGSYAAFQDYPLHEWLDLLVRGAEILHPAVPTREGLRRIGHGSYGAVADSMIGKVLMSMTGSDVNVALRLAPRIYRLTATFGAVEVSFVEPGRAIVQLRDLWDFPDAYHVGVYEGGLRALGRSGEVRVRTLGCSAADLELTWV